MNPYKRVKLSQELFSIRFKYKTSYFKEKRISSPIELQTLILKSLYCKQYLKYSTVPAYSKKIVAILKKDQRLLIIIIYMKSNICQELMKLEIQNIMKL